MANKNYQDEFAEKELLKGEDKEKAKSRPKNRSNSNRNKGKGRNCGNRTNKGFPKNSQKSQTAIIETGTKDNDPSWYIPNGQVAKDFGTFSSNYNTWTSMRPYLVTGGTTIRPVYDWIPGVMSLDIMPTFPTAEQEGVSSLYQASVILWESIQAKNSRTPEFEAADLMNYIIAASNAYAAYLEGCRAYSIATDWVTTNAYYPIAVAKALDLNLDDIADDLAQFRGALNMLGIKLAQLALPKSIDYTNRLLFLAMNMYVDSTEVKTASIYVPNLLGFYKLIEGDPNHPTTYLNFIPSSTYAQYSTGRTREQILDRIKELSTALYMSDDMQRIQTTLVQAFGWGSMYELHPIAENFKCEYLYDTALLSQFENAYIAPPFYRGTDQTGIVATLEQATGINEGWPVFNFQYDIDARTHMVFDANGAYMVQSGDIVSNDYVINFHKDSWTPEELIKATRLTSRPVYDILNPSSSLPVFDLKRYHWTELILGARIITRQNGTSRYVTTQSLGTDSFVIQPSSGYMTMFPDLIKILGGVSKFDWHPKFNVWEATKKSGATVEPTYTPNNLVGSFIDYNKYTLISESQMSNINEMAVLGLFTPKELPGMPTVR